MKLSEAHIEKTCSEWLALDGWRSLKTDPVSNRAWGKGFGELGMCDRLYIRYHTEAVRLHVRSIAETAKTDTLWIEWKRRGGKNSQHQKEWRAAERARGALVWAAMEDFQPTIEMFQEFYRCSGLMRTKI